MRFLGEEDTCSRLQPLPFLELLTHGFFVGCLDFRLLLAACFSRRLEVDGAVVDVVRARRAAGVGGRRDDRKDGESPTPQSTGLGFCLHSCAAIVSTSVVSL